MTTILAAAGTAVLVLLAGNLPWAWLGGMNGLGAGNLRLGTRLPWAVLPTALYLWVYWRFIGGSWGSADDAAMRRANLRANRLSAGVWGAALASGTVGFGALLALLVLSARLVRLPAGSPIDTPPEMPAITAALLLSMQSIVAGVSEEAAFRGYMQSMIERRHGVILAVVANGILFGLLHFGNHPRDVLLMLPYYVAVSAVYGGLTWATDSILPAVVLHSVGDIVVLTRWWLTGKPEWLIGATEPSRVWDSGVDGAFLAAVIVAVVLAATTATAYVALRRLRVATGPSSSCMLNT
jgi:membrane protease YdiL (CAAX protease family)